MVLSLNSILRSNETRCNISKHNLFFQIYYFNCELVQNTIMLPCNNFYHTRFTVIKKEMCIFTTFKILTI